MSEENKNVTQVEETTNDEEFYTGNNKYIVIEIPEDTIELTILPTVLVDGKIRQVKATYGNHEIQKRFQDAEENYIPPDATFTLTEKSKAAVELSIRENIPFEEAFERLGDSNA